MSRSDYSFATVAVYGETQVVEVVQIADANLGNMSVTNDIENVINEIAARLPNPPSGYAWIYRDSSGAWDEILVDKAGNFEKFVALPRGRCLTELEAEAVARLLARQGGTS
jgi:hypothetical protein